MEEPSPYEAGLGIAVEAAGADGVRLRLPYREGNANPGGALHGGVLASLIGIAAERLAKTVIPAGPGVRHQAIDVAIEYLAAAMHEDVLATARVLRSTRDLVFASVELRGADGKAIAAGQVVRRAGAAAPADRVLQRAPAIPAAPDGLPGFVRFFTAAPFMSRLGLEGRAVGDGLARVELPWSADSAGPEGGLHEGAIAALVDSCGAMAAWSLVPLNPKNRASTIALHVSHHAPARPEPVIACAQTLRRTDEIFWNLVAACDPQGRPVATATVSYRIVVPQ